MGILAGLAAAAAWFVLWPIVCMLLGVPIPVAAIGWVVGLAVSFAAGVRLGDPHLRGDPVARIEERQRARRRFEARTQRLETEHRLARLAREDREADEGAEARVRALVDRRQAIRGSAEDAMDGAEPAAEAGRTEGAGEGR